MNQPQTTEQAKNEAAKGTDGNQAAWNNDSLNQPKDADSIAKTDPMHQDRPHVALEQADKLKDSGKDIGLVNPPITSVNPSSGATLGSEKAVDNIIQVAKPNRFLNYDEAQQDFEYPFEDTEVGAGFFIPVEAGGTTDALMAKLHKQVYNFTKQTSECEKDENGDDVWESVVIQTKKRKDGVIQLASDGKPIVGANQTNRPKLVHAASFILRPVVKGDDMGEGTEAQTDGVLVIRAV